MAKTHPHIDSPSQEQLAEVVAGRTPGVRETYLAAHRLMLEAVPDVTFSVDVVDGVIGYAAHQYGYNGWGMAAVAPHAKWVTFVLLGGAALPDPSGVLQGTTSMRHVKLTSAEQLTAITAELSGLIAAAVHRNDPKD